MENAMTKRAYIHRINDDVLARRLAIFGAVELCGTKWSGKTRCAQQVCASETTITGANSDLYQSEPSLALVGNSPHLVDEWQDAPAIWDATRRLVDDEDGEPGLVVLTGSSTPGHGNVLHDGAGRIARIRMRPMSLAESGESTGRVSLAGMFDGEFEPVMAQTGLGDVANAMCRGGWPLLVSRGIDDGLEYVRQYLDATFDPDIMRAKRGKDARVARATALSLARNLAQAPKISTVAQDIGRADSTASEYLELLRDLYIVDAIGGWDAPVRSKSRLRIKPKYYFCDPSIPVALLGMSARRVLDDSQTFGLLFETLVMRDLAVYMAANPAASPEPVHYYRDSDGLEVDFVLELADGRWAGIEVKVGESKANEGAASLLRLRNKVARNPAARNAEPSFLAVVTSCGMAHRRPDGVYVIPIGTLGA